MKILEIPKNEHILCSFHKFPRTIILTKHDNMYLVYKLTTRYCFKKASKERIACLNAEDMMSYLISIIQKWRKL